MREYLFHGKKTCGGDWVEGYYCDYQGVPQILVDGYSWESVIPETVGQWTGIYDTNSRKIFEGDIISIRFETDGIDGFPGYSWYESAEVVFSEEKHSWLVVFNDGGEEMYLSEYDDINDVYVIGTVFDDVDLLER